MSQEELFNAHLKILKDSVCIMMFDSGMFLLSFDTDYIGW